MPSYNQYDLGTCRVQITPEHQEYRTYLNTITAIAVNALEAITPRHAIWNTPAEGKNYYPITRRTIGTEYGQLYLLLEELLASKAESYRPTKFYQISNTIQRALLSLTIYNELFKEEYNELVRYLQIKRQSQIEITLPRGIRK